MARDTHKPPPPPSSSSSPTSSSTNPVEPPPKPGPNPNPNPNPNPTPGGPRFPFPDSPSLAPPPPTYGFHMLDRRTISLADGSLRSYFALPPDHPDFHLGPELGRFPPFGPISPDGWDSTGSVKREFGERDEVDEFARQRQQLLHYGNAGPNLGHPGTSSPFRPNDEYPPSKHLRISGIVRSREEVDPVVLKAFLKLAKLLIENIPQRNNFLENHGPFQCLVCAGSSKDFPDVHNLIMHAYHSDNADIRVDHMGLHRAICVLMGWNYLVRPDNSKAYQFLPADEAAANRDDLILWPPVVIIHNTNTGKGKDGRMEGLGNKTMDNKIRDMGFPGGKSKSLYSRDGHLGITLIKFASDQSGLMEAIRLADHFEHGHHGRRDWLRVHSMASGMDDESNPSLVLLDERTGERRRILYGYLGTACDMDKLDYESRKKVVIESKFEKLEPPK